MSYPHGSGGYPQQQGGYPPQGGYAPPPNYPQGGYAPAPSYGMPPGQPGYVAPGQPMMGAPMMMAPGYPMAAGMVYDQHGHPVQHGHHDQHGHHGHHDQHGQHGFGVPMMGGVVGGIPGQPSPVGYPTADLGQQTSSWAQTPIAGQYYGAAPSPAPIYGTAAPAAYYGGAPAAPGYNVQGIPKAPRGTIYPFPAFNPEADSKILRKAMKGIGTDENAIISVVANRSNAQRQEIKRLYKTMHGKDLIHAFESETSANFRATLIALFSPPTYYDAWSLHHATQGAGTKEGALIEILCTRTNQEIYEIVRMYKSEFHRDLEADIAHDTSGCFRRLLVSACQASRNELSDAQWQYVFTQGPESIIDRGRAQQDAHALLQAGEAKWGTDESCFNEIMSVRNHFQLRATFEEYAKISGRDISSTIDREFSGDIKEGFLALVKVAQSRPLFFAERLHHAMKGAGTHDSTVIRILVSRSEIDLADIKRCYTEKYHKSLVAAIESETSGDYKHILAALVGRD